MDTKTPSNRYTPFEFASKYPAIDSDQLLGYVSRNLKKLDEKGIIYWKSKYSSVYLIDEKKFFKYILYFPIKY